LGGHAGVVPDRRADPALLCRGHRFPAEVIARAVRLYVRFHLTFRDVQDLLAERGIVVRHGAIRQWCGKSGPSYAVGVRRRRARPGDKWYLDEGFSCIGVGCSF
jgi:putative transposase